MVSPIRMAFSLTDPASIDFTGATTIQIAQRPYIGGLLEFYHATVKAGQRYVAVDWGDGHLEVVYPDVDRKVTLRHVYRTVSSKELTVRISNALDEFLVSGVTLTEVGRTSLSVSAFEGARLVSGVSELGSNIVNRTFARGMFANTSITEIPQVYSFGSLTPIASAPCVPLACFYGCRKLSSVRAIRDVVAIDARAFEGAGLEDISAFAASSLVHIGYRAFAGCTGLTSLLGLSGTLTRNSQQLFGRRINTMDAAQKEQVFAALDPEGSRNFRVDQFMLPLGGEAFQGCIRLADISALRFTDGIILPGTFDGCRSLATVPDSVKNCYYGFGHEGNHFAGAGCICLREGDVTVMSGDDNYTCAYGDLSADGIGLDYWCSGGAFTNTKVTEMIGVPRSGQPHIANDEFSGCTQLRSVTISSVDKMGYDAFAGCTYLLDVTFTGRTKASVRDLKGLHDACYTSYPAPSCPFGLPEGCLIHCSDGDLRVVSGNQVEDV